jgi:hypothetical protein
MAVQDHFFSLRSKCSNSGCWFTWLLIGLITVYHGHFAHANDVVITDDGSEAYEAQEGALTHLDFRQATSTRVKLDTRRAGETFALAGFAPTGELVGYSEARLWAYDSGNQTLRVVFNAGKDDKIRYATAQASEEAVLVSVAPKEYDEQGEAGILSFVVRDIVKLTWDGKKVMQEHLHTGREGLPPGAVFDSDGSLFFPLRDVYHCEFSDGYLMDGGRCLPLSTECVFTAGSSPSTLGARAIAVSEKMIYVYVNRLGGSGEGYMVRFPKPDPPRTELKDHDDYQKILSAYSKALAAGEVLQDQVANAKLCASPNGKHVLMLCNEKWFRIEDDGKPVLQSLKVTEP